MADQYEIWYSPVSSNPENFVLLPGGSGSVSSPFNRIHAPVTSGQYYYYRARRYYEAQDEYSPWSSIVATQAPYPVGGPVNPMAEPTTGVETLWGLGIQPGTDPDADAVKAAKQIDIVSGDLTGNYIKINRRRLMNTPSTRTGSAAGRFEGGGDIEFEVTPEGVLPRLLMAMFGEPTSSVVVAAPPVPERQRHIWKNVRLATSHIPVTIWKKMLDTYFMYPSSRGNLIEFGVSKEDDTVLTARYNVMCLNEILFSDSAASGLTTMGADTLDPFSPMDALVSIAGVASAEARGMNVSINKGVRLKNVLNRFRGASALFAVGSEVGATVDAFFSTMDEYKRFMGVAPATALPVGGTRSIIRVPITLEFLTPTYDRLLFTFPNASYGAVGQPVTGPDEIMQALTVEPEYSGADGTDVIITLESSETNASLVTVGTAVTGIPANSVQPAAP